MHFTTKGLLHNGVEVKVLAINPTRNYIDVRTLPGDYRAATGVEAVTVDTGIRLKDALVNLFGKESYFVERFVSEAFSRKLTEVLQAETFDVIQLEHLYLCKYIPVIRAHSESKIVLRPQNVEYVIWQRYLNGVRNPVKKWFLSVAVRRLRRFEQSVPGMLDGIIALTKEDAEIFGSFPGGDDTPMIVVPMGYDYDKLDGYDLGKQLEAAPVVYHLGSMDWLPNVEAVRWFCEKVLPVLEKESGKDRNEETSKEQAKDAQIPLHIYIAGRSMPAWVNSYASDNVSILGEITDPLEFQADKHIMVVPLWSGSGIRAKIVEGLALGKVIISTTIGAQGIDYENGTNMLIADTPEAFAGQIKRCVESADLRRELSRNARKLGLSNYHYGRTARSMMEFYKQLV